jgi:hypothetical protein
MRHSESEIFRVRNDMVLGRAVKSEAVQELAHKGSPPLERERANLQFRGPLIFMSWRGGTTVRAVEIPHRVPPTRPAHSSAWTPTIP